MFVSTPAFLNAKERDFRVPVCSLRVSETCAQSALQTRNAKALLRDVAGNDPRPSVGARKDRSSDARAERSGNGALLRWRRAVQRRALLNEADRATGRPLESLGDVAVGRELEDDPGRRVGDERVAVVE